MVWKYVKEGKVDIAEIEDKFAEKAKAPTSASGGGADSGVVKMKGPTMKSFFDGKESHRIFLNLSKLPKDPNITKTAAVKCDTNMLTPDQIGTFNSIWPVEASFEDFEREHQEMTGDETWEKAEAYMINYVDMPSLPHRLKVWVFSLDWNESKQLAVVFCKKIFTAFAEIKSNEVFMSILG